MNKFYQLLNKKQFKEALDEAEKEVYLKAFEYSKGNKSEAARLLRISRGTLMKKLDRCLNGLYEGIPTK